MKSVLITGGTGGLGSEVTLRLISEGYRCSVPYRSQEEAQNLRARVVPQQRDQLFLFESDLSTETGMQAAFDAAAGMGPLHALVHLMGGVRGFQPIDETSVEDWDFLMNLNLRSYFLATRLAMKHFRESGAGRIVGIGAMASLKPGAKQAGYGVAKAGVSALTKILADEGREFGVTANCIIPSVIYTEANLEWGSEEEAKKWVTPAQIAGTVVYLLGDGAAAVNGSDIRLFAGLNL
jgi:NAD(P)-dependent dehydrogenase (short-subunit alcohol dehydrogenase family)